MKTFKSLSISLLVVAALAACNLPGRFSLPTSITDQNPCSSVATLTLHVKSTQTEMVTILPTHTSPMVTTSPTSTPIPANTLFWSVYNYTCELADGGATMTMNLAWSDRSNSEEGYNIYRDKLVIATLAPNSTSYVDIAFVATGKTLSYSVEAFNKDWRASTSTITYGCQ